MSAVAKYIIVLMLLIPFVSASYDFNDIENPDVIIKYDYSTDTVNVSGFDSPYYQEFDENNYQIFNDDAEVGDSISWGMFLYKWDNLTINISTPVSAADFGVVWEYNDYLYGWNDKSPIAPGYTNWNPIPNVIDNTNNFSNTGTVTLGFKHTDMNDWYIFYGSYIQDLASYRITPFMIRARVVVADTVTEGGQITGDTNISSYIISVTSEEATPPELLTQSQSNGWMLPDGTPCVQKAFGENYYCGCDIRLVSNANLTIDEYRNFDLGNDTNYRTLMSDSSTNIIRIGEIDYNTNQTSEYSRFRYYNMRAIRSRTGGYNNLYGNVKNFAYWGKRTGGYNDPAFSNTIESYNAYWDCFSGDDDWWYWQSSTGGYIVNSIYRGSRAFLYSKTLGINNFIPNLYDGPRIYSGTTGATVSNTDFGTDTDWYVANNNVKANCVNCKFDNIETQVVTSSSGTQGYVYYTYEAEVHDLYSNDITDFNLTIVDALGRTLHDGQYTTPIDILVYNETQIGADYWYNPLNVTIDADGYIPYETRFNLTYDNRYQTYTLGTYPFSLYGLLNITQGQQYKFHKCGG